MSRNTVPAGLFIGKKVEDDKLEIWVDYTTPTYRDFKIAEYIYTQKKDVFCEVKDLMFCLQNQEKKNIIHILKRWVLKKSLILMNHIIKKKYKKRLLKFFIFDIINKGTPKSLLNKETLFIFDRRICKWRNIFL